MGLGLGGAWWLNNQADRTFTIRIEPWAEEVLLDGENIGSGREIVLSAPPAEGTLKVRHRSFKSYVQDIRLNPGDEHLVRLQVSAPLDHVPTPAQKKGQLPQGAAVEALQPFRPRIDRCILTGSPPDTASVDGVLRVFVGPNGAAIGFVLDDGAINTPGVRKCLEPLLAAPAFPKLENAGYAVVRYEYHLASQAP